MNSRVLRLERLREDLAVRSRAQRQQIIAYGVSAGEALQRMRLLVLAARIAARVRRFRERTGF